VYWDETCLVVGRKVHDVSSDPYALQMSKATHPSTRRLILQYVLIQNSSNDIKEFMNL
jgi:hypothetical protein